MENIIEELIDEAVKQDSLKDLELEAVGKVQGYNVVLSLGEFGDDWTVNAANNISNIQCRTFGDNYNGAKESFESYAKKYGLKDSKIFERDRSIKFYVAVVFTIFAIGLLMIF